MENTFRKFFDNYLETWRSSSLPELKDLIAKDFKAREVSDGNSVDFDYEKSVKSWEQGFNFVKESGAQWDIIEVSVMPLKDNETTVILSATLMIKGKRLETSDLFMQTFKLENNNWKLVRSYIEAGIPLSKMSNLQFN